MKRNIFLTLILLISIRSYAQMGVSYHDSAIPFFGLNYTINDRVIPEFRVATDVFTSDFDLELVANYIFYKNNDAADVYAGAGYAYEGIIFPLGVNIYPLENKSFGFHIEAAWLTEDEILRGSWGIRYRFN